MSFATARSEKPVAVEVENRHPEALATRVEEAGRLGDVGEAFRSVVPVEDGACPVIRLRGAVALVDAVEGAEDVLLDGPLHVVEEEEVEVPVAVGVEPGGAARKARMGDRRRMRGFPKNPVAGVFQQAVRPERGQIDVLVPVGVVVGDGRPDAVERGVEPRAGGRVLEGSVAAVEVERRGGFGSAAVSGPAPAVHEEEVLVGVAVGVEESHPAAHRLREVLLAEGSVLVDEADPGRLRHLDKVRLLRGSGSSEGERGEQRPSAPDSSRSHGVTPPRRRVPWWSSPDFRASKVTPGDLVFLRIPLVHRVLDSAQILVGVFDSGNLNGHDDKS